MGWFRDTDEEWAYDHEGYVAGVVRDDEGGWRDLGLHDTTVLNWTEYRIQVVCSCGWRTPRMSPPPGAEWAPVSVFLSADQEDTAREIWVADHRSHVAEQSPTLATSVNRGDL